MFSRYFHTRQITVFSVLIFYLIILAAGLIKDDKTLLVVSGILPFAAGLFYLLFFYLTRFAYLLIFLVPLSVNLRDIGFGFGISLPAEIMIVCLAFVAVLSFFLGNTRFLPYLKHPVSVIILLSLIWNVITAITSSMPFISMKFVLIKTLFVTVFYFFFLEIFHNNDNIKKYLNYYTLALLGVIVFAIFKHINSRTFNDYYYISQPFYVDHTIYSACIAMLIPFAFIRALKSKYFKYDLLSGKAGSVFILAIIIPGFVFSYSRAGWLSLFAAVLLLIWLKLKFSFIALLSVIMICCGILFLYQDLAIEKFSRNKTVSQAGVLEHAQSVTNLSTDVSNKERINRWMCAIRMFKEKPVFGFGPGTYQFQYAPFQKPNELTRMSTFNGDRGESHSEYLKPLSESGLPGFILQLTLVLSVIYTGMRVYYRSKNKETKLLSLGILLGLSTYFVHGFVNFYLDTDKAACLFWGMIGMLVALDTNVTNKIEDTAKELIRVQMPE